jgi:succinate dehydrogenase / fumarate reductase cytochrome b subunit
MALADPASIFGRHEFVVRRLHSLTGMVPIGAYLCFHLATNAAILDGPATYQRRADQIHLLGPTTILVLEWSLIFLPILFHGLVGMIIVTRGKRNVRRYPYRENWRYTLQRVTGVVAFAFILWHVLHMHGWFRFEWWREYVAEPLGGAQFDPKNAGTTAAAALQASALVAAAYVAGVLASVYHLANGVWTMGITWGVWTSPKAQRRANLPCAAFGVGLAAVGVASVAAMWTLDTAPAESLPPPSEQVAAHAAPAEPEEPCATIGPKRSEPWPNRES